MKPFSDGISVRAMEATSESLQIVLNRSSWGVGYIRESFFRLSATPIAAGTQISMQEGDFFCGFSSCRSLELSRDVEGWLSSRLQCRPLNTSF
jgi:hypothetical protein